MAIDWMLVLAGALVGLMVGLTGMGGGALLTPILVLVFRMSPLAAVSSDLVTSLVMKPFGAAVHARHGTINWRLLGWLSLGSVPAAFVGSVAIGLLGRGPWASDVQAFLKVLIAVTLAVSVASTILRLWLDRRSGTTSGDTDEPLAVRPGITVVIGVLGGLAVGFTSVGAGSLVIAMLLLAYPGLSARRLVGTDIAQAIPLVASASLGHLLFGDVRLALTASLILGAVPAVLVGAKLSASAPIGVVRPLMAAILTASALALVHVPGWGIGIGAALIAAVVALLPRRRGTSQTLPVRELAERTPTAP